MKLKALLLGSAAAMLAVSGANAADAVVAEPEPVDYVKVCDMYGAGWWYIPGTETCLKMDGLVRSTYTYTDVSAANGDTSDWTYRARLNVHAREETDYGTLASTIRIQGDGNGGADANAQIDRALMSLGGMRLGYTDQFWATNHGYGTPGPIDDAPSGYDQALILDYTFAANGLAATVGVQDEAGTGDDVDFYGGVSYSGGMFSMAATLGYDGLNNETAYRLSASINPMDGLTIKGLYAAKANANAANRFIASDWEYGVGANYQATDAMNVYVAFRDSDVVDGQAFVVGGKYKVTSNFSVQAEATFAENSSEDYRLRVTRSF